MQLEDFHLYMMETVRSFKKFWKEGMADDASTFPREMGVADWHEQFINFVEINDAD